MPIRASMQTLVDQLRAELGNDAVFTDVQLQTLLDAHASHVQSFLRPTAPLFTQHVGAVGALEDTALLYSVPSIVFPGWGSYAEPDRYGSYDAYANMVQTWWVSTIDPPVALATPADYTIDLASGIVTTPTAYIGGLFLVATAYAINAAAADGWERIAARYAGAFDYSDPTGSYSRRQLYMNAIDMARAYRGRGMGGLIAL